MNLGASVAYLPVPDHGDSGVKSVGMKGYDEPTVVWRLKRGRSVAHATIIPGTQTTVSWFFDGSMDRVENYDSLDLAVARAEQIRGILEREGWTPAE
jgi:hypothetical protein